ncbi:hypothetical protein KY317_01440 [Candidatus Woesearchaeota archaeon]|nr:hypothetical protein [Candidatus Woesearchaeota archaeon]
MRRLLVVCAMIIILCAIALGDVIHMCDGRKITGKIIREDADSVVVKTRYGEMSIPRSDIDHIEKGKVPEEIYEEKAKALKKDDGEGHYQLGLWCKENNLNKEAKEEFKKAIAANPDHEDARKQLGYEKVEGKWVLTAKEAKEQKKTKQSDQKKEPSSQLSAILNLVEIAVKKGKLTNSAKLEKANLSEKDFEEIAEKITDWKTYKSQKGGSYSIQAAGKETYVSVPSNYNPKKPYPLILALPGAGGTGRVTRDTWISPKFNWSAKVRKKYIIVAPPADTFWQWPTGKNVYTLFDEIKNTYNIDTNNVLLMGFSNGGHASWTVGMKQPSLFTGLGPVAGGPVNERGQRIDLNMLANLINLPVHWVYTADDRICPLMIVNQVKARYQKLGYTNLTEKRFDSGGHLPHSDYWGKILEWFEKQKKDLYAKKIVFITDHAELDTAYWIRINGITGRAKLTGEISGSTIKLTVQNATKITVYLSDKMLDLDKPIEIEVNGTKKFSGTVKRSAKVAVEEALRRNDRNAVFAASVEVDAP